MVWPFSSDSSSDPPTPQPPAASPNVSIPVKPYHPSQQHSSITEDENNPFIAFRRFADEQFRLLAQGLSTVPSLLSSFDQGPSRWDDSSFTARASQPLAFMSQHFEPPLSPPPPSSSEAIAATRCLLTQSRNALGAAGVSPSAILALFRDVETAPPYPFDFYPDGARTPVWLSVDWFKRSRYSPLQCETDTHLHQQGSMWRAAFEDLMSESLGQEMRAREAWSGARDEQELYGAWAATGRDWMLGLMCRGVVPPLLPGLYRLPDQRVMDRVWRGLIRGEDEVGYEPAKRDFWELVREVGWFDGDEREEQMRGAQRELVKDEAPRTELDAYERFLGRANGKEEERVEAPKKEELVQSKILSTLSTTERTTLPDGTVTTKVILKRRFADGREESTETVSTTHGSSERTGDRIDSHPAAERQDQDKNSDRKKGWFWG
ncbi:hypothetical protein CAC42_3429 [Sphaceloma murrayae]|uniref:Uncharacterized protein n=1 Tax=Sphaceloma murrayae TaxID=2082308 RepID=A0A2K1R1C6_9PEZI|nr:hypothetical protein CAC42_3429 [Sphaceloma murrayae]